MNENERRIVSGIMLTLLVIGIFPSMCIGIIRIIHAEPPTSVDAYYEIELHKAPPPEDLPKLQSEPGVIVEGNVKYTERAPASGYYAWLDGVWSEITYPDESLEDRFIISCTEEKAIQLSTYDWVSWTAPALPGTEYDGKTIPEDGKTPPSPPSPPNDKIEGKIELKLGWNMISVPVDTTLNPADIPCDAYKEYIYRYDPEARKYVIANTLEPGKGYWIYAKENCSFTVSGSFYTFNIALIGPGWNIIGSETNSLPLENLKGCDVRPDVWWYDPTKIDYVNVSILEPGRGHWVWVPNPCSLTTKRNGGSTYSYAKVVSSIVRTGAKSIEIPQPPPPPPPMDLTPPTTMDGYDGLWHNTDFTITLTATDDLSGVAETYYKINDGPTKSVSPDGQPYITTESASNTLEYWSVDNADNEELPHKILAGIKLDKTAPIEAGPIEGFPLWVLGVVVAVVIAATILVLWRRRTS